MDLENVKSGSAPDLTASGIDTLIIGAVLVLATLLIFLGGLNDNAYYHYDVVILSSTELDPAPTDSDASIFKKLFYSMRFDQNIQLIMMLGVVLTCGIMWKNMSSKYSLIALCAALLLFVTVLIMRLAATHLDIYFYILGLMYFLGAAVSGLLSVKNFKKDRKLGLVTGAMSLIFFVLAVGSVMAGPFLLTGSDAQTEIDKISDSTAGNATHVYS